MNIWAVIAVFAALILGACVGFIVAYAIQKRQVTELTQCCKETSTRLKDISSEYDKFMKSVYEENRWPKRYSNITIDNDVASYLKEKYLNDEIDPDCEDESDNLYI